MVDAGPALRAPPDLAAQNLLNALAPLCVEQERQHLERLARAWQMDVRFLGKTTRNETLGWIGAADELVHASRLEGLSTVVREAEHLGVPVTLLS